MANEMVVLLSHCFRDFNYFNEHKKTCNTLNVGTSKLSIISLLFCYVICLSLWMDFAFKLKAIKVARERAREPLISDGQPLNSEGISSVSLTRRSNVSFFYRIRVPLAFFFVISTIIYLSYFVIVPLAPEVYTLYDRIVTYTYLAMLSVVALMLIVYGARLSYISKDYLNVNLRKASSKVTVMSCISGALVLIYAIWAAVNGTRARLEYKVTVNWTMFLEQLFEVISLCFMAFMLRSSSKNTPKWKKDAEKKAKESSKRKETALMEY